MTLHQALATHRDKVVQRWKDLVRGTLVSEDMSTIELVDHMPEFVDELVAALRADVGLPSKGPELQPDASSSAVEHGEQRLRLGFSLESVVREYGALRDAIMATATEQGAEINLRELNVLFNGIVTGIAHAVSEYARQRDVELVRQSNEHFAFIAHELRNPLSSATMAVHILKESGQLSADDRSVHMLEKNLQRTAELIDQTLQFARVASGIQLRRGWTTLKELFDDAVLGTASEAEIRKVTLQVVIENDARINADIRLVRSALGNLLRNGVKYTAAGSLLVLRGNIVDGRAVIEVEDCCGGLPPGKVEKAFAPFVRLDAGQGGFGLGLAIAKQAADAHGGSIRVQNLPGKGCIFVLELPVAS